jgi:ribosomal peptide maturation radical SAM protein 1
MDALLFNMPFSPIEGPSIGLTLLAECLKREKLSARVVYPNVWFDGAIGRSAYDELCLSWYANTALAGDWIFSRLLEPVGSVEDFVVSLRRRFAADPWLADVQGPDAFIDRLPGLIERASTLLARVEDIVARERPSMVGFSSCFHQHLPSLAAARRIKARFPQTFVALGGSNCHGEMGTETFRQYPFLDAVVCGPGEIAIVALARFAREGKWPRSLRLDAGPMSGVYVRRPGDSTATAVEGLAPEIPLDTLPFPDYTDFIEATAGSASIVFVEASRGCWWGQKHHCVFCSENATTLRYRTKSADRILEELRWLSAMFPQQRVHFTDEILDPRIIEPVLGKLAETRTAAMFLSAKANLKKREVAALAAAGVDAIQPGIESLDNDILGPMRKGVTTIQNVQLLKWCRELGIAVQWAILVDFPYERPESYSRMAALIPNLTHLSSPHLVRVVLQRFSPLFWDAEAFGVGDLVPNESYRYLYAMAPAVIEKLAYRFTASYKSDAQRVEWWDATRAAVRTWQQDHQRSHLFYAEDGDRLAICDTRAVAQQEIHILDGLDREVFEACDEAHTEAGIADAVAAQGFRGDVAAVQAALRSLIDRRLVLAHCGRFLALPYRLSHKNLPPHAVMARFIAARSGSLEVGV